MLPHVHLEDARRRAAVPAVVAQVRFDLLVDAVGVGPQLAPAGKLPRARVAEIALRLVLLVQPLVVAQLLGVLEGPRAHVARERPHVVVDHSVDVVQFPQAVRLVVALVARMQLHVDLVLPPQVSREQPPQGKVRFALGAGVARRVDVTFHVVVQVVDLLEAHLAHRYFALEVLLDFEKFQQRRFPFGVEIGFRNCVRLRAPSIAGVIKRRRWRPVSW